MNKITREFSDKNPGYVVQKNDYTKDKEMLPEEFVLKNDKGLLYHCDHCCKYKDKVVSIHHNNIYHDVVQVLICEDCLSDSINLIKA